MAKSKKKKTSKPAKAKAIKKAAKTAAKKVAKKTPAKKTVAKKPAAKPVPVARVPAKPARRQRKSIVRRAVEGALRAMPRLAPRLLAGKYETGLDRNAANYQPLTPLTFLERAAAVFPNRTAIIHGKQRFSYADYYT